MSSLNQLFPSGLYEPTAFYESETPGTIVSAGSNLNGIVITGGILDFLRVEGGYAAWGGAGVTIGQLRIASGVALSWDKSSANGRQEPSTSTVYLPRLLSGSNVLLSAFPPMNFADYSTHGKNASGFTPRLILHYLVL